MTSNNKTLCLLIAGGGTGGHIYPGLAVAEEWVRNGGTAAFAGVPGNLEERLIPQAGYPFLPVEVHGLTRGRSRAARLQLLRALGLLATLAPLRQAMGIIREYKPDVVLGTGGYVSGPVLLAARLSGVPTMILQLDARPGLANQIAGLFVTRIAASLPESVGCFRRRSRVLVLGAPVRPAIISATRLEGRSALGLPTDRQTTLVFGGSLGSRAINEAVVGALRLLGQDPAWAASRGVIHVTGRSNPISLPPEEAETMGLAYRSIEYCDEMPMALAASDVAVCRAGAITVAELTARGLPAILIPWAGAADNHQEANARALERHGAARVILDRDLSAQALATMIREILDDPAQLRRMAEASRAIGKPDATARISAELQRLATA